MVFEFGGEAGHGISKNCIFIQYPGIWPACLAGVFREVVSELLKRPLMKVRRPLWPQPEATLGTHLLEAFLQYLLVVLVLVAFRPGAQGGNAVS